MSIARFYNVEGKIFRLYLIEAYYLCGDSRMKKLSTSFFVLLMGFASQAEADRVVVLTKVKNVEECDCRVVVRASDKLANCTFSVTKEIRGVTYTTNRQGQTNEASIKPFSEEKKIRYDGGEWGTGGTGNLEPQRRICQNERAMFLAMKKISDNEDCKGSTQPAPEDNKGNRSVLN